MKISELSPQRQRVMWAENIINKFKTGGLISQEVDSLLSALYENTSCKKQDRTRLQAFKDREGDLEI